MAMSYRARSSGGACWFESSSGHKNGQIEIYLGLSIFILGRPASRLYISLIDSVRSAFFGKIEPSFINE